MRNRVLYLFIALLATPIISNAQTTTKKELSCYEAYKKEFDERGAYTVEDGKYTGVIIAIGNAEGMDCVYGKVAVEGGAVTTMWLMYEDNSYEFLDRKYTGASRAKILNGITEALKTTTGETIYVIFVDKIKPKKKQVKKATGPGNGF